MEDLRHLTLEAWRLWIGGKEARTRHIHGVLIYFHKHVFEQCWRRHASGLFSGRSPISYIVRYFGSPQAVGHGFSPPGDYACKETCKVTYNDGSKGKVDVFRSGGDTQSPAKCILALQCEWGAECEGACGSPAHQFLECSLLSGLGPSPTKGPRFLEKKYKISRAAAGVMKYDTNPNEVYPPGN